LQRARLVAQPKPHIERSLVISGAAGMQLGTGPVSAWSAAEPRYSCGHPPSSGFQGELTCCNFDRDRIQSGKDVSQFPRG